jgi:signal transduction histidine kinase
MDSTTPRTRSALPRRSRPDTIRRQQALLALDGNLCSILDAMPELVMVLNGNRQIIFANKTLADFARSQGVDSFIGMRPGEILSCRSALDAEYGCGTAEGCRHCGAIESILAALQGHKAAHECRMLRQTPQGVEALDLKIWGTPFRWQGERFAMLAAIDISNEKRREVLERLFFHDVLNTAGTITIITEMLMKGTLAFDEVKDDLWGTVQTLVNEIRGQREILAAENDELKVRFSLLEGREILDAVCTVYRNSEAGKGKSIAIVDESTGLQFISDPTLLTRVLGNLLKNALEASQPGRTVTLTCRSTGTEITFCCHNEGVIPRDIQLQIFQRSFSTKGVGRGIGTYSVKLITEKYLQGRVSVVSSQEAGTTFLAVLPVHPSLD